MLTSTPSPIPLGPLRCGLSGPLCHAMPPDGLVLDLGDGTVLRLLSLDGRGRTWFYRIRPGYGPALKRGRSAAA